MRASLRQVGNISIIDLSGRITIGEGDVIMREKVSEVVDEGQKNIILNLNKVTYMDSAGIGELVACLKRVKEKGGMIKLLNASGKVHDLLQLTKLEDIFESYKDEKEAINSF